MVATLEAAIPQSLRAHYVNRRDFLASSAGGAVGAAIGASPDATPATEPLGSPSEKSPTAGAGIQDARALFPRASQEVFLNAAGGTPLSDFAQDGLRQYEEFWRLGPGDDRGRRIGAMLDETRAGLARLIGARGNQVAFVMCTKHGEQMVLDCLPGLREGGNVVTNDLHFGGSLHNLIGLRMHGVESRIVHSRDWQTDIDAMADAIDDNTELVSLTLVSNVNGHIEPVREIADIAHAHGAYVYADIIQAAGVFPMDVNEMGIDFAAGNGYKWLFGPHGSGFFYVRTELQGAVLENRMYPGFSRAGYAPWVNNPDPEAPEFSFSQRADALRYEPGHEAYLCYSAVHAGLNFINDIGVDNVLAHGVALNQRLLAGVDGARYECISPHVDRSPIIAFRVRDGGMAASEALQSSNVVVALADGGAQIRVSPSVYNNEGDVDALIDVLNNA